MINAFEKLLVKLVEAKLNFAVIGGFACAFNGWVRSTLDVDILLKQCPTENPIFLHDSYFGWHGTLNPFFMPCGMNKGFKVP